MSIESDLDKKTTLGDADGPDEFIPELGMVVPTFIKDRDDLVPSHALNKFKRLKHHVPFKMRGHFRPEQWPEEFRKKQGQVRCDMAGYVLCAGVNARGTICASRAVNRSRFCRSHGGCLFPADKKISGSTMTGESGMPLDRVAKLDRVQLFMQGLIDPSELDDDEVRGRFVRDSNGIPVKTVKLGAKFEAIMHKELLQRMNDYLRSKAPRAIEVMYEVADSDVYEAADRIKAAQWLSERVIGKTPDVIVSVDAKETPFQSILSNVDSGSREDYRKSIASERPMVGEEDNYIDAEVDESYSGQFVDDSSVLDEEDSDSGAEVVDNIAAERERKKLEIKEARDRIKKAKSRRYAARATGADSLDAAPFLLDFKENKKEPGFVMKLIPSSTASPAKIDRLVAGS